MKTQKSLKLLVPRQPGESAQTQKINQQAFDHPSANIPPQKLLADLLKRQARKIMADVTDCGSESIGAHIARLCDLQEILRHLLRHDYKETAEFSISGAQLQYPATLADFLACLEITRRQHRAPAFINQRDAEISEINRKIDLLAGLFASSRAIDRVLEEGA